MGLLDRLLILRRNRGGVESTLSNQRKPIEGEKEKRKEKNSAGKMNGSNGVNGHNLDDITALPPDAPKGELKDISPENLTQHVIKISSNVSNERIKFLFSRLIQHAHDFIREVELQRDEWEAAWQFLTDVGHPNPRVRG